MAMHRMGIIASLPAEMAVLRAAMQNEMSIEKAGIAFLHGQIAGKEVVACICGVGKVNAARTAQALIDHFAPAAILHTGVAGSLCPAAAHLSLVVSESLAYHDTSSEWLRTTAPYTDVFPADAALREALAAACEGFGGAQVGKMVTGDQFIDDPAVKEDIYARTHALCTDMEVAATAQVALCGGVPYCAIKCISDMADDSSDGTFADFVQIAADKAAGCVIAAIAAL